MNKTFVINRAITFLIKRGYIQEAVKAAGYDGIRLTFHAAVWGSVFGVFNGGSIADGDSRMAVATSRAYLETLDLAYQDGGGELPIDEDTQAWAKGVLDDQLGYVDELFDELKQLRKDETIDATAYAKARADAYASALDGFYVEARMRGSKNIMLTWQLGSTERHCKTCAELDGKSHKISWYLDRDYIPRKSGAAMDCGGWNCDCSLVDKNGNEYTV